MNRWAEARQERVWFNLSKSPSRLPWSEVGSPGCGLCPEKGPSFQLLPSPNDEGKVAREENSQVCSLGDSLEEQVLAGMSLVHLQTDGVRGDQETQRKALEAIVSTSLQFGTGED